MGGMSKRAKNLVIFGLLLGLVCGLGIEALRSFAARELMGILEDEVRASCPCEFKYDSVELSFVPIAATARNVRLVEADGQAALTFERLHGSFSLRKIAARQILLDELQLINGRAIGVGPESATFKFIDHLAAPVPPERDRPDRWKLKLLGLRLNNGAFVEKIGLSEIRAENVGLVLKRTPGDDFNLSPEVERLILRRPGSPDLILGRLALNLFLEDEHVDFRSVELALNQAWIRLAGTAWTGSDSLIEGGMSFALDARSLSLPPTLIGGIAGTATISGTFGAPELSGEMRHTSPIGLGFQTTPPLVFDELGVRYQCRIEDAGLSVAVPSLRAQSSAIDLTVSRPLSIKGGRLGGTLAATIREIAYDSYRLRNVGATLDIAGEISTPRLALNARVGELRGDGLAIPDLSVSAIHENGSLALSLDHRSESHGAVSGQGSLQMRGRDTPELADFKLAFTRFRPQPSGENGNTRVLELDGSATLRGPLSFPGIGGDARFALTVPGTPFRLDGSAQIKAQELTAQASGINGSLRATLRLVPKEKRGSLDFTLSEFKLPGDTDECSAISLGGAYTFPLASPLEGSGKIDLSKVAIGCAPFTMEIAHRVVLPVERGVLTLPNVQLTSAETAITINGSLSETRGFDLGVKGDLHLNSLLGLIPSLDDLRGRLSAQMMVSGPIGKPRLSGSGKLTGGGFALETADLSGEDISGALDLSADRIVIEEVKGSLNSGKFKLNGEIYPLDLARSRSALQFSGIAIQPNENTNVVLAGDLALTQALSRKPVIEGKISIESAEFQKSTSLASLVRGLASAIFSRRQAEAFKRSGGPNIELNIGVVGSRNIFVVTNWANAELAADVTVRGTVANPTLEGRVETLTGWFGLKNRQFDITSGALLFRATTPEPTLEIMGETTIPTRTGDTVLVILEATGPLSSPRISLSSDRGLSERDILALMTQGGRSFAQTRANTIADDLETEGLSILSRYSLLRFHRLLSALTRIDSISLEPTYNQQTGLIEPALVAEKRISDRFSVIGESLVGGTNRVKALYDLSPDLMVSGLIENDPVTATAPVEMNLTYTVLARQDAFLNLRINGNTQLSTLDLRRGLRISENSRITPTDAARLGGATTELYRESGFFSAQAEVFCEHTIERYCRNLRLEISEGERSTVSAVQFEGEDPRSILTVAERESLGTVRSGIPATKELLSERRTQLIRALRNEGYIAARVDARYEQGDAAHARILVFTVTLGKPVTFTFRGNTVFSPARFLETINLFKRRQPFGNNTIHILTENIERLYREAGYLYATTRYSRVEDPVSGRINFLVDIVEGSEVPVVRVSIEGNTVYTAEELDLLLKEEGLDPKTIRAPRAAVAEEINAVGEALRAIYIEGGYPETSVVAEILPREDGVMIEYRITEGPDTKTAGVLVTGFPPDIAPPRPPRAPFSTPKANRFIDQLLTTLVDAGYRTPGIATTIAPGDQGLVLEVEPGAATRIGEIVISGNTAISRETIERQIAFHSGEPWNVSLLDQTKRDLLRLGLFSRVTVTPLDGALDTLQEDILVAVTEHPLQTLEVGGGVNSEYGLHIFGEGLDRALFKDGRTVSLRVDTYYDKAAAEVSKGIASLRYADPYFLRSSYSLTEDLRFQRLDQTTQEFNLDRVSFSSSLYRSWEGGITHVFGHTLLSENLDDVSPGAIVGDFDEGSVRLGYLSGLLTLDNRDSPLDPRAGNTLSLDYKIASPFLGSEADFFNMGGRFTLIQPLPFERFSLAFASRVETGWTYGDTDEVPISQRFYLGGRNSIRGFRENSLGPRGADGAVIGGDLLVGNNLEARYLMTDSSAVHLFFDAGTVYLRDLGVSGDDMRYSTGIGFRFLSPLGPIGFDIGHPLDERSGEPSLRFHFSIGSNF